MSTKQKHSEVEVLKELDDSSLEFLWKLIGTPETRQYFWKSNANDQHYYFLERSVWLMRLIRAIEVEDTEILKAFKKKVFKDEVDISEGAQWDRKFTKPLEALKTVLEGKEKSKALEKLIEWFQKSANDSDEFLWVVSEKLSPMKDGGSYIRISQRRTDSENKIRVNKNLPPAQQQINSLADTEGTKENINNSSAAEKQIITPVGLEGTKENINNSSAAEQQIDSSVDTEGTKENNYNNSLKQPNSQEVGFKSVDGYKKESSALKPLQLDPGSKIKTDSGAWGWISVIKCSSAESNSWFVPDAIDMPGFCKIMPRAIVRRLEISASARYIAIFSPSKSSYEKRLKSLFRFFKKFRIYKNQIEERCNYYREEKMREELELLRRYNGSRYSELRMDALKTSLLGSSIWDTFDEKLGLSKAMETFESTIDSRLKYHGEETRKTAQREKTRGDFFKLSMGAVLSAFAATEVVKTFAEWFAVWNHKTSYHFFAQISLADKNAKIVNDLDAVFHDFESTAAMAGFIAFLVVIGAYMLFRSIQVDDSTEEPSSHHH